LGLGGGCRSKDVGKTCCSWRRGGVERVDSCSIGSTLGILRVIFVYDPHPV